MRVLCSLWKHFGVVSLLVFSFCVTSSQTVFAQQENLKVDSFTLMDAGTDQPISGYDPMPASATIALSDLPAQGINVRANTSPYNIGSVKFLVNGKYQSKENAAPYALAGNNKSNYHPWKIGVGEYKITAEPYSQSNFRGQKGTSHTVRLKIVDEAPTPLPVPDPSNENENEDASTSNSQKVTSFTLIDARTDQPIPGFEAITGDLDIAWNRLPAGGINVRANTSPSKVGSVKFLVNGKYQSKENTEPYALAGNNKSDYHPWNIQAGVYRVTAEVYSKSNFQGEKGEAKDFTLKLVKAGSDDNEERVSDDNELFIKEEQLTDNGLDKRNISVYGDYVAWDEFEGTSKRSDYADIKLYHIPTQQKISIPETPGTLKVEKKPIITSSDQGIRLYWEVLIAGIDPNNCGQGCVSRIQTCTLTNMDPKTCVPEYIPVNDPAIGMNHQLISADDAWVAIERRKVGPCTSNAVCTPSLMAVNVLNRTLWGGYEAHSPQVSGDRLVFYACAGASCPWSWMSVLDLKTGDVQYFPDYDLSKRRNPSGISDNFVAYLEQDSKTNAGGIFVYDFNTANIIQIADNRQADSGELSPPDIDGKWLVWKSPWKTNRPSSLFVADRRYAVIYELTDRSYKSVFDISGDHVAWLGSKTPEGQVDVYLSSFSTTNRPPSPIIQADVIEGTVPLKVNFDGSRSHDVDGEKSVSYKLNFGDGYQSSGPKAQHTYRTAGTFEVSLEIEDERGWKNKGLVSIRANSSTLGTPTAKSPRGEVNSAQPAFSWSTVKNAKQYELWVGVANTQGGFTEIWSAKTNSATTYNPVTSQKLEGGMSYTWWVRALDGDEVGAWSEGAAFTVKLPAIGIPQQNGPYGEQASGNPKFSWSAVNGATHYEVWVGKLNGKGGYTTLIDAFTVQGTSKTFTYTFSPGEQYGWWVRAVDANQVGEWSAGKSFTIKSPLPAVPQTQSPSGTVTVLRPQFNWTGVSDATYYEIRIGVSNGSGGYSTITDPVRVTGTTYTYGNVFGNNQAYAWWVRSGNAHGVSAWSTAKAFTVSVLGLGVPVQYSPVGDVLTNVPQYIWSAVSGASYYTVRVETSTGVKVAEATILADKTGYTFEQPLSFNQSYRWSVRAGNVDQQGAWSAAKEFRPVAKQMTAPVQKGPLQRAVSQHPTFAWGAVEGAVRYEVSVGVPDGAGAYKQTLNANNVTGTTHQFQEIFITNFGYSWWVRTANAAGEWGPWSPRADFFVDGSRR